MMYLVSIHRSHDYNHSEMLDAEAHQAIDDLNDDMVAAGVRLFVGGLQSIQTATSFILQPSGEVLRSEGQFLKVKQYVDGFWVLECESLEDALEWGEKAARACRGSVEVRPFAGARVG
jgi:hypothetical protein